MKGKEKEAITTTRIYRVKWEFKEAINPHENAIATLRNKELPLGTFWWKKIAEQCLRGGKIFNFALHADKPSGQY